MFGETVLTHNQRMNMMEFMQENESGSYVHDQILLDFIWALEKTHSADFRNYGKLGITNPVIHYMSKDYNFLNNFRLITDADNGHRVFAYAYFDYPIFHSPLYISIVDGENSISKQISESIDEIVQGYKLDYKTTVKDHYPMTIKLLIDEKLLFEDNDDEDEGDLSYILRKNAEQEKYSSKKDTLMFIHKMLGDKSVYTNNYEKLISGEEDAPRELFEVIDRSEFKLSELRQYMRGNISGLLSKK